MISTSNFNHKLQMLGITLAAALFALPAELQAQANTIPSQQESEAKDDDADNDVWKKRKKYFNIGYAIGDLKPADHEGYNSDSELGISLNYGKTWYFHKKPIAGLMKFGVDVTFLSLNYDKMSEIDESNVFGSSFEDYISDYDLPEIGNHKLDVGIQVGPSLSINPVDRLMLKVYFRYCPTYSMTIFDESFSGCYASMFNYGLSIGYGVIAVGAEHRFGSGKYECTSFIPISDVNGKTKLKTSSTNFYISFRF